MLSDMSVMSQQTFPVSHRKKNSIINTMTNYVLLVTLGGDTASHVK